MEELQKNRRRSRAVRPLLRANKARILIAYQNKSITQIAKDYGVHKTQLQLQFKEWGINVKKAESMKKAWQKKYKIEALRILNEKKERKFVLCSVTNYIVPNTHCENCQIKNCLQELTNTNNFICSNTPVNLDLFRISNYNTARKIANEVFYKEARENARKNQGEANANNT